MTGTAVARRRPRAGSTVALAVLVPALAVACGPPSGMTGADGSARTPATGASTVDPAGYARDLVEATNAVRADAGLSALPVSECARAAAAQRAADLVGSTALEHAPMDAVLAACAPATFAAENLSRASAPASQVVQAWLGSAGHRANLLSASVTELGVGCAPDGPEVLCSQVYLGP